MQINGVRKRGYIRGNVKSNLKRNGHVQAADAYFRGGHVETLGRVGTRCRWPPMLLYY